MRSQLEKKEKNGKNKKQQKVRNTSSPNTHTVTLHPILPTNPTPPHSNIYFYFIDLLSIPTKYAIAATKREDVQNDACGTCQRK